MTRGQKSPGSNNGVWGMGGPGPTSRQPAATLTVALGLAPGGDSPPVRRKATQGFVSAPLRGPAGALAGAPTYNGVAPELGHLADAHGRQEHLPDLQLEHVPDDNVHGVAHALAVVYHRPLVVTFRGAEVEDHLVAETGTPGLDAPPRRLRKPPHRHSWGGVPGAQLTQPQPELPPGGAAGNPLPRRGPRPTLWQPAGQEPLAYVSPGSVATDPGKPPRDDRRGPLLLTRRLGLQKIPKALPLPHARV